MRPGSPSVVHVSSAREGSVQPLSGATNYSTTTTTTKHSAPASPAHSETKKSVIEIRTSERPDSKPTATTTTTTTRYSQRNASEPPGSRYSTDTRTVVRGAAGGEEPKTPGQRRQLDPNGNLILGDEVGMSSQFADIHRQMFNVQSLLKTRGDMLDITEARLGTRPAGPDEAPQADHYPKADPWVHRTALSPRRSPRSLQGSVPPPRGGRRRSEAGNIHNIQERSFSEDSVGHGPVAHQMELLHREQDKEGRRTAPVRSSNPPVLTREELPPTRRFSDEVRAPREEVSRNVDPPGMDSEALRAAEREIMNLRQEMARMKSSSAAQKRDSRGEVHADHIEKEERERREYEFGRRQFASSPPVPPHPLTAPDPPRVLHHPHHPGAATPPVLLDPPTHRSAPHVLPPPPPPPPPQTYDDRALLEDVHYTAPPTTPVYGTVGRPLPEEGVCAYVSEPHQSYGVPPAVCVDELFPNVAQTQSNYLLNKVARYSPTPPPPVPAAAPVVLAPPAPAPMPTPPPPPPPPALVPPVVHPLHGVEPLDSAQYEAMASAAAGGAAAAEADHAAHAAAAAAAAHSRHMALLQQLSVPVPAAVPAPVVVPQPASPHDIALAHLRTTSGTPGSLGSRGTSRPQEAAATASASAVVSSSVPISAFSRGPTGYAKRSGSGRPVVDFVSEYRRITGKSYVLFDFFYFFGDIPTVTMVHDPPGVDKKRSVDPWSWWITQIFHQKPPMH